MSHGARYLSPASLFITFTICKNSDKVGQDFRAHKTFSAGNIHLSLGGPDFTAFSKFWDESFSTLGNTL